MRRIALFSVCVTLVFAGCNCDEAEESGWDLVDDIGFDEDTGPDVRDASDAADVVDAPDVADVADVRDVDDVDDAEPVDPWEPEPVEPDVPSDHALTDRTSLAVDDEGTLWLGYHACQDFDCSRSMLRVVHRPVGGDWAGEDIREHEGIFGVSVVEPGEPIVVFPDSLDNTYKAAKRRPGEGWPIHTFSVERSFRPQADGFDVTEDGERHYVTFAPEGATQVELASHAGGPASNWEEHTALSVGQPQAAMERGLRADPGEGLYLVNRDGHSGVYGVYRYDQEEDAWPQSVQLEEYTDAFVHSLYITQSFELCMSADYQGHLLVTCGSMFDLTQDVEYFSDQPLASRHPSSIIEGDDGTLYVAYNPEGNQELRVASRAPDSGAWEVETVFDGPSYGVSTAIDRSGDLVISFYTCDERDRCSLQVLWETPE